MDFDISLAPFSFKWNDAFCKKRRGFIHCSLKKKRPKTVPFWTTPYVFFFLWTCRKHGKGAFVPLFSPSFLPPFSSKRRRPKTPICSANPWPSTCWRNGGDVPPRAIVGRQHSDRPNHVSTYFHLPSLPINTEADGEQKREREHEKRRKRPIGKNWGGKELKTKRKKKRKTEE